MTRSLRSILAAVALAALACEPPAVAPPPPAVAAAPAAARVPETPAPKGELSQVARPTRYTLALDVRPERDRFSGVADIEVDLAGAASTVWMHAEDLSVKTASVRVSGREISAKLEQVDPTGVAALRVAEPIGPGHVTVHVEYDAPWGKNLQGMYKVVNGGRAYAFTQFESIYARKVFPSFDQPGFKTPFDVTLVVPKGEQAVSNARVVERAATADGGERVRFATTAPLPTYLVAFAVGPLDVVEAPAIPPNAVRKTPLLLRGVTAKGRGRELTYALAHTGEIVAALERWFGIPFPYEKLDIIAVPDKGGAMENAGAITFREYLVLLDPARAPLEQRRAYFYVMAHELAHQWTGDLVTMRWWDDTWLNEAFATFMGNKIAAEVAPELGTSIADLERTHGAMGVDALVAARSIRQPVHDTNDISNAFDSITYVKGATVLAMFENFLGPAAFQAGVHDYLTAHAFGNATADDLLAALSGASKRDAATAMRTFLDQPGVPLVEASLVCGAGKPKLHLEQSRYLPLGSAGSAAATWDVPVCARVPDGAKTVIACTLLATRSGDIELPVPGCPAWVHPNADGLGYYRWTLAPRDAAKLARAGVGSMTPRERSSFAQSVRTGFSRGTTPAADAMRALAALVHDPNPAVAFAARDLVQSTADWFAPSSSTVAGARLFEADLYRPLYAELGWQPKKGAAETAEKQSLRSGVVRLMTSFARDPAAREEATRRGRAYLGLDGDGALHPEAVDANLAGTALASAMADGDAVLFDRLVARLHRTEDEVLRLRLLGALGSARRPALAARARALALDPSLRGNEWATPLEVQLTMPETRDAAWAFFKEHLDAILARPSRAAHVITWAGVFCDEAHGAELQALYDARLSRLEGAPRTLAETLEGMRLCVARKQAQQASASALFSTRGGGRR